jgi:hypothetical protein
VHSQYLCVLWVLLQGPASSAWKTWQLQLAATHRQCVYLASMHTMSKQPHHVSALLDKGACTPAAHQGQQTAETCIGSALVASLAVWGPLSERPQQAAGCDCLYIVRCQSLDVLVRGLINAVSGRSMQPRQFQALCQDPPPCSQASCKHPCSTHKSLYRHLRVSTTHHERKTARYNHAS